MSTGVSTVSVLGSLAIFVGVYVVHEFGHYAAGAVAGIPASARRFVVLAVPPHVALADGDEWVSPFENERFSAAYDRYDPETRYGVLFTAGGMLAQTVVALPVGVAAGAYAPEFGTDVVWISLAFLAGAVAVDAGATAWRGRPSGDATHLWRLSPLATVGVLALAFGAHAAALAWLL